MNISVFKRISVGAFITFASELAEALPDLFARQRAELCGQVAEMERRLNADRRNMPLRELRDDHLPNLRLYLRTLKGRLVILRRAGQIGERGELILREIERRFKKRRNVRAMIDDARFVIAYDAPEDGFAADVFAGFKSLAEDMDALDLMRSEEEARICSIGGSLEVRDEAMRTIRVIVERAKGMLHDIDEEGRVEAGKATMEMVETMAGMAGRMKGGRKRSVKKKSGCDTLAAPNKIGESPIPNGLEETPKGMMEDNFISSSPSSPPNLCRSGT